MGVLFVAAMFFAPLAGMIPAYATAGALIYVAMLDQDHDQCSAAKQ